MAKRTKKEPVAITITHDRTEPYIEVNAWEIKRFTPEAGGTSAAKIHLSYLLTKGCFIPSDDHVSKALYKAITTGIFTWRGAVVQNASFAAFIPDWQDNGGTPDADTSAVLDVELQEGDLVAYLAENATREGETISVNAIVRKVTPKRVKIELEPDERYVGWTQFKTVSRASLGLRPVHTDEQPLDKPPSRPTCPNCGREMNFEGYGDDERPYMSESWSCPNCESPLQVNDFAPLAVRQIEFLLALANGQSVVKNAATRTALRNYGLITQSAAWEEIELTRAGRDWLAAHDTTVQPPAPIQGDSQNGSKTENFGGRRVAGAEPDPNTDAPGDYPTITRNLENAGGLRLRALQENLSAALNMLSSHGGQEWNKLPVRLLARQDVLHLTVSDGYRQVNVDTGAKVDRGGLMVVPLKTLREYVNLLPEGQISLDGWDGIQFLHVSDARNKARLKGYDPETVQTLAMPSGQGITVPAALLKRALTVGYATCDRSAGVRPTNGVLLNFRSDGLVIAGCDSFKAAEVRVADVTVADPFKVIIPATSTLMLTSLLSNVEKDVTVYAPAADEVLVGVAMPFGEFITTPISGMYPAYESLFRDSYEIEASLPVGRFESALKRVSAISRQKEKKITFTLAEEKLTLSAVGEYNTVSEDVELDMHKGGAITFHMNAPYLLTLAQQARGFQDAPILLRLNAPNRPLDFTGPDFRALVAGIG